MIWFKKMSVLSLSYSTKKVTSTEVRIANISQSLLHKMAENSWYEEITSLSPYVFTTLLEQELSSSWDGRPWRH